MTTHTFSRRSLLQKSLIGVGVTTAVSALGKNTFADPDPTPEQLKNAKPIAKDPEIYSFTLGDSEAIVVLDGIIVFDNYHAFAPEASNVQIEDALKREFLPTTHLTMSINSLVLRDKSGDISLFDSGAGNTFGASAGRLETGLVNLGIIPEQVKNVFITHAHPDHIAGLLNEKDEPRYKSARIVMAKTEHEYWMAEKPDFSKIKAPAAALPGMHEAIRNILTIVKPNLDLVTPGTVGTGVEAVATAGHTPGHLAYKITRGIESLVHLGDTVHAYALQFAHPEWSMIFDCDPAKAIKTREALFATHAKDKMALIGYHLPFPGIGHVRALDRGFEWVPRPWVV